MPFLPACPTPIYAVVALQKADPAAQIKKRYEVLEKGWKALDVKRITSVWAPDYTELQTLKGKTKSATREQATAFVKALVKTWDKAEIMYTIQSVKLSDKGKKAEVVVDVRGAITVGAKTKNPDIAQMTAHFNHLWTHNGKEWFLKQQAPTAKKKN